MEKEIIKDYIACPNAILVGKLQAHEFQLSFPQKLYMLLNKEAPEIISWTPDGKAFLIYDIDEFISKISLKYFKYTKFPSFQRQLNLYGFRRQRSGMFQGAYFHSKFTRGDIDSVVKMQRHLKKERKSLEILLDTINSNNSNKSIKSNSGFILFSLLFYIIFLYLHIYYIIHI